MKALALAMLLPLPLAAMAAGLSGASPYAQDCQTGRRLAQQIPLASNLALVRALNVNQSYAFGSAARVGRDLYLTAAHVVRDLLPGRGEFF